MVTAARDAQEKYIAQYFSDFGNALEGDPDRDGLTNLEEYRVGTDPTDPASRLMIAYAGLEDRVAVLRFTAVAGLTYTVQVAEVLNPGAWVRLVDVAAPPTTRTVEVRDDDFAGASQRFYRVVTPRSPPEQR